MINVVADFSSDSSSSHASPLRANLEADLCSVRLSLFEETERRKKVEASLTYMQNRWKNMAAHFCKLGLSFPPIPDSLNAQQEIDPVAQLCQEIIVGRFVNEAIERGIVRAELEATSKAIIDAKNHEISRLHDRLQYYEAVNHEMSQRNQEAMGMLFLFLFIFYFLFGLNSLFYPSFHCFWFVCFKFDFN